LQIGEHAVARQFQRGGKDGHRLGLRTAATPASARRIALSMRLDDAPASRKARSVGGGERVRDDRSGQGPRPAQGREAGQRQGPGHGPRHAQGRDPGQFRDQGHGRAARRDEPAADGAMADALKRALQRR
jgi:uncharacterized protein